jgi:hypothetical protein
LLFAIPKGMPSLRKGFALIAATPRIIRASELRWQRWQRFTRQPRAAQNRLLQKILRRNKTTAFGREHGFAKIQSVNDYRQQVPVGDYERFRPYIERAQHGETSVLTAEPILMFTMTSGSTGAPKLIPVTASTRKSHARLTELWFSRLFHDHPDCAAGKIFALVGAAIEGRTAGGIPYGAASGLIYRSSPSWIRRAHALPYEIAEIKDFQAKYYAAMRLALEQDVTFLGTPNPSTLLRLVDTADGFRDEIIKDIHDGTLSSRYEIPSAIRAAIAPALTPNRARARATNFRRTTGPTAATAILAPPPTDRLLERRQRRRSSERTKVVVRRRRADARSRLSRQRSANVVAGER